MTEIVRASLGLPTLRRVPSLKIPNVHIILEKEDSKYVWVIEYWNLRFICNLVLGIWGFVMRIEKLGTRPKGGSPKDKCEISGRGYNLPQATYFLRLSSKGLSSTRTLVWSAEGNSC